MEATKDQLKIKDNIDDLAMNIAGHIDNGQTISNDEELKALIIEYTNYFNDMD